MTAPPTTPPRVGMLATVRNRRGVVTAVEIYRGRGGALPEDGALWSSSGRRLATAEFASDPGTGWVRADLPTPVRLHPGARYVPVPTS